jgi:aspartate racemase
MSQVFSPPAPATVGILGGMGPAAGADFVRLFVDACARELRVHGLRVHDQAFPEHWLAQVPVPDRTQALMHPHAPEQQPLDALLQALGRLVALGARSVAMACNTAHAWHASLQARFAQVELLHVAQELALELQSRRASAVILLATQGTYQSGLFDPALAQAGIRVICPDAPGRQWLMEGIYQGVKRGDLAWARHCFAQATRPLLARHGDVPVVMACTEIPLALPTLPDMAGRSLIDPAHLLAQALARRSYAAAGSASQMRQTY